VEPSTTTASPSNPDPDPAPVAVEPAVVAQPVRQRPTFAG